MSRLAPVVLMLLCASLQAAETERAERQPRRERGERRDRRQGDAPALPVLDTNVQDVTGDLQAVEGQDPSATSAEDAPRNGRRSRDRYGRDRRNGRDRNGAPRDEDTVNGEEDAAAAAPAAVDADAETVVDSTPRRSYFSQVTAAEEATPAAAETAVAAPVEAAPVAAAPAPVVVAEVAAAPAAPAVAPAAPAAAAALPRVQAYALPVGDLVQLARDVGLEWVNSDADKVAAVQAAIAAEPQPVRIPRERPPVVVIDEGPLVLVETRKDLSDMVLPFEQTSTTA